MCFSQFNYNFIKIVTTRTNGKAIISQPCFLEGLPWRSNTIADKVLNLFDEYATRCVHLSPQDEECTSSFGEESKMYTSGIILIHRGHQQK